MKAIIYPGRGEFAGQFFYVLEGENGKRLSASPHARQKISLIRDINKYHPLFTIVDTVPVKYRGPQHVHR